MRTIERSSNFKRDYKHIKATPKYRDTLDILLKMALDILAHDEALPAKFKDHLLVGNWHDYRECHLKPDLLLIYRQCEPNLLRLARLGSHSDLF